MPEAAVAGAVAAARRGARVVLVGDEVRIRDELGRHGADLPVVHADDVIGMDDSASNVRRRRSSRPRPANARP